MVNVSGYIGSHKTDLKAYEITSSRLFPVGGRADYIAITEVYPDTPEPVHYRYTVTAAGICPYERSFRSLGYGKLTYFIKAGSVPAKQVKLTRRRINGDLRPVLISSVYGVTNAELDRLLKQDRFPILGLLPTTRAEERDRLATLLRERIPRVPEYGISPGFSSEIRYANQTAGDVEAEIRGCKELAKRHKMPVLLGPVAWWVGTPGFVDDGAGGRFGDVKYQQICYAPDREFGHDPDLAELLGQRYNCHYKLSVPNRWSNTPWLTMNSKTLNDYRFKRLNDCVRILKNTSVNERWIIGVYLENEPRYWDTHCEAKLGDPDPEVLWADFNPNTVEAAREDGVVLDPDDGLSPEELSWLHRNVGQYNQDTVDAYRAASREHGFGADLPLYTHSLQHRWMFPGNAINHSASEWAYAISARTGLEGMFTTPSDFYRVRDWGSWANINREENDGADIDLHLWDLRVSYIMGSDLYNSYNWHAIGPERFFAYVEEFVAGLPTTRLSPAALSAVDRYSFKMKVPMKLQAFSRIAVPVTLDRSVKGSACAAILLPDGYSFSSECRAIDLARGDHVLSFDFTTPAECSWREAALVTIYFFDEAGRMALEGVRLAVNSPMGVGLELDLITQRALSLAAIARAASPAEASAKLASD